MQNTVEIFVSKSGSSGRPMATVFVDPGASLGSVNGTIQKHVTRNADLLKRLGLKACGGCISGFDLDIRHRFEEVMRVELEKAALG